MRRLASLVALGVALASALAVTGPVSPAQAKPTGTPTPFGLGGYGVGAAIVGGQLPAGVGPVGNAAISCTNEAGVVRRNATAAVDIPGLGTVEAVKTKVWTTKKGATVASNTLHRIADIKLIEAAGLGLSITGIEARTRAWHDRKGYHAKATTNVLGIKLTLPGGVEQQIGLPSINQPIVIPGLVRISLGATKERSNANGAKALATALVIKVLATDTTVRVGRARSRIGDAQDGVFAGTAYGVDASVLGDLVKVGKTSRILMPCAGTKGEIREASVADVNVPGLASIEGVKVSQRSWGGRRQATAWEKAETAAIDVLDGLITVEGITARAYVKRVKNKGIVRRSSAGTKTLEITVAGEVVELPPLGVLEIPGIVKIEEGIVEKTPLGIKVTALRLTLLEGSGAVINLGVAKQTIGRLPR